MNGDDFDADEIGDLNGVVGENDNTNVGDDNVNVNVKRVVYNDDDDENFMIIVLLCLFYLINE